MTETRNLLVQEPERVSQTETATEGQTGAARGVNPEPPGDGTGWHLGFTQQDPQGDWAPHKAPGDECWVESDLEADVGHMHAAADGDGVDFVEGHTVYIIQEDAPVHRHLLM